MRSLRSRRRRTRPRPEARLPQEGGGGAAGWFAPRTVHVTSRRVGVDGVWSATLVITGLPREVPGAGWLAPLSGHPGLVDVSLHVTPIDPQTSASQLRRRLARLEAGRRSGAEHGRLPDPHVDAAAEDAQLLAERVARGEAKLFTTTLTVTVTAATQDRLDDELAAVRALLASLLMTGHPVSWRAWHGHETGLPLGRDRIRTGRVLDTGALAASFPFTSPDLPPPVEGDHAVLIGHNLGSASLVFWDRWNLDNHNSVVLGRSGAGKSYLTKLEVLRSLYTGVEVQVIDPEDEYARLAGAVGGTVIRLGAPGVRINPLDLDLHTAQDGTRTAAPDTLTRRRLSLHTFLGVALTGPAGGELTATETAILDEAITTTYLRAGITDDPTTWTRPAPVLGDLRDALLQPPPPAPAAGVIAHALDSTTTPVTPAACSEAGDGAAVEEPDGPPEGHGVGRVAADLARRLRPFVDGSHSTLFNGPTTHPTGGHLSVWSLKELPEELRPLGTMVVLDAVWRTVTHPHQRRRRLVVVDEAWMLLQNPAGARFLLRAAKAARKHWCGLVVATQDTADVLASDLGRAVITNSATQILLRQAPQAIDQVATVFGLSVGERGFLLTAERGDGLLTGGDHRVAFAALASTDEDELITTDPAQLATHPDHPDHPGTDSTVGTAGAGGVGGVSWIELDHPHPAGSGQGRRPW